MTKRDQAVALAARGFAVFPLIPSGKTPLAKGWRQSASRDRMDAWDAWTRHDYKSDDYNIGIVGDSCIVLDVDVPGESHSIDGMASLATLGWTGKTLTVATPSGGKHLYFKKPEGRDYGQTDLAPGINVRSSGGYVVGPGSYTKHIPGKQAAGVYTIVEDCEPAELPECLERHLTLAGATARYDESSFAGEWDHPYSIEWCWRYIREWSAEAVKGARGSTGLKVAHVLGDRAITKPTALEMLQEWHATKCDPPDDDENQMEHVLNSAYSSRQKPFGCDCAHEFLTPIVLSKPVEPVMAATAEWPEPDMSLVKAQVLAPPQLPLEAFGQLAPLIRDIAASRCAPPDYPVAGLLAICASLIGSTRCVNPWCGYYEMLSLFCIAVGTPSQVKTPSIKPLLPPLRTLEDQLVSKARNSAAVYDIRKKLWTEQQESWEKATRAAIEVGQELPPAPAPLPPEPASGRIIAEDATPEKVAVLLSKQPRGLLWYRDELSALLGSAGQHGGRDARGFLMELFNGQPGRRERIGNNEDITIPFRLASLLGTIQPDMIEAQVFSREDNGMTGRMLIFWPDWAPRERPTTDFDSGQLTHMYGRLASLEHGPNTTSIPVPLTHEAAAIFESWWKPDGVRLESMPDGLEKGAQGKMPGYVLRIACVIEFMWWASGFEAMPPGSISVSAINGAIQLADSYFAPMRARALSAATVLQSDKLAAVLANKIVEKRPSQFTIKELKERWSVRLPPDMNDQDKTKLITAALAELIDRGWLRATERATSRIGGRPTKDYIVNPKVYSGAVG